MHLTLKPLPKNSRENELTLMRKIPQCGVAVAGAQVVLFSAFGAQGEKTESKGARSDVSDML